MAGTRGGGSATHRSRPLCGNHVPHMSGRADAPRANLSLEEYRALSSQLSGPASGRIWRISLIESFRFTDGVYL